MAGWARAWVEGGLPIGAVALAYALYIALRLAAHDYDPSYFVQAGDRLADRSAVPPNLHVLSNSLGYDGQAYYRLALHPLTAEVTAYGVTLDRPGYRQQRILYPALVWTASLGRPALVPAMLIAINYLALCLMAWVGVVYARLLRQPAALGILFPLWPGFLYTLGLDLTEIIAGTCLLGSLLLLRLRRFRLATVTLIAGVLARETAAVLIVALLLLWLVQRVRGQPPPTPWYVALAPLGVMATWQAVLLVRWGGLGMQVSGEQANVPLQGLASLLYEIGGPPSFITALLTVELVVLGLVVAAVMVTLRYSTALPHEKLAWGLYATMLLLLNHNVWLDTTAILRASSEQYLLGTIVLLGSPWRPRAFVFAAIGLLWVLIFSIGR